MPSYVGADAFELNLIGLYTLRALGADAEDMRDAAAKHVNNGCEPVRDVLRGLAEMPPRSPVHTVVEHEPDEIPAPY